MTRILVTGVRGKTGVPLAGLLSARGATVLGGSSDPATVDRPGVEPVRFDWDAADTWASDADAVYLVRPDRADAPELVAAFLERLPASTGVVLLSGQDAVPAGPEDWSARVEDAVRRGGHRWTILRPSWFMQVFTDPRFYRDDLASGTLPFPGGGAAVAWIDARDIAAVAAVALTEDGHEGQVHEITGPAALTLPETAAVLGVTHREISIEEAVAGTGGFDRDLTVRTFEQVRDGVYARRTDTVARVTGRPARPLAELLGGRSTDE